MLEISDLHVSIDQKKILKGVNLTLKKGEVHAVMGPNGSGKTTLASVLTGEEGYEVTQGSVRFRGIDLLELDVTERALHGLFLAFQYPVEIPGVSVTNFLRSAVNLGREHRGEKPLNAPSFLKMLREKMKGVGMSEEFVRRSVNENFSGGEKKRNEILQLLVLNPSLAILDETDSGLDIDAMKTVAKGIKEFLSDDKAVLVITHYQRLLNYLEPDKVHVMKDGRIQETGDKTLALKLEKEGYEGL